MRKNFSKSLISLVLALILSSSLLVSFDKEHKRKISFSFYKGLRLRARLLLASDLSSICQNMPEALKLAIDEINTGGRLIVEATTGVAAIKIGRS